MNMLLRSLLISSVPLWSALFAQEAYALKTLATLECRLSMVGDTLTIRIQNRDQTAWSLMKRGTPLEGLLGDHLRVTRNGKRIAYTGRMVKRGPPTVDEYLLIAANAEISERIALPPSYMLGTPGKYTVSWSGELSDALRGVATVYDDSKRVPSKLRCNKVSFALK